MNDYTPMPQLVPFLKYQLLDFTNPELLWDQDYIHIIRGCINTTCFNGLIKSFPIWDNNHVWSSQKVVHYVQGRGRVYVRYHCLYPCPSHLKHHKSKVNTAQTMKVQIERNTTPAYDTVIWQSFPVLFFLCLIT